MIKGRKPKGGLKTIKHPATLPLTPERFVNETMHTVNYLKKYQEKAAKRIQSLNTEYAKKYSQYQIGQVIDLPDGAKDGYTTFLIEHVQPEIKQGEDKASVTITFILYGIYKGEGKEDLKGIVRPEAEKPI